MRVVKNTASYGLPSKSLVEKCLFYYIKLVVLGENSEPFNHGTLKLKILGLDASKLSNLIFMHPRMFKTIGKCQKI